MSARGSNNSDSIEDYIRNWKKNDSGKSPLHSSVIKSVKSNNSSVPSNKDVESVKSLDSTDATSKPGNKPPVLLPKPNPDLLVKRFKFKKLQKLENDNILSTLSTSTSPAVDWSSFATTTNNVRKFSTEFEKPIAPTEMPAVRLPEKNLFPSLEPIEGQKVEEEFDKITAIFQNFPEIFG